MACEFVALWIRPHRCWASEATEATGPNVARPVATTRNEVRQLIKLHQRDTGQSYAKKRDQDEKRVAVLRASRQNLKVLK